MATRTPPLRKLLIANRGEIAVRIARTCREVGVRTVAVYSEPDAGALHVRFADEALAIGPAPATDSYLRIDRVVEAALRAGADGVHPGYGFLSENAQLADACAAAGLILVGPTADALRACGDKARCRALVRAAGVPLLPGTDPVDDTAAERAAAEMGFPVLVKSAAGGGGKGIHRVERSADLPSALRLARGEARSAFGDDRVYIEKVLDGARHIEVQIVADAAGGIAALGERECSVQRRHQKVIEETPSPALTAPAREALLDAAVRAARAVGYRNAGTVEFLFDARTQRFYFLEINARLQVEHPITEMVTGLDLVAEQIRIAAGLPLSRRARESAPRGAAIECRIAAEDVRNRFLPSLGTIRALREPAGPGVRVDAGWSLGASVTRHYDPLLAKFIAWAPTRDEAIARMRRALDEAIIAGVHTTIPFHRWALADERFTSGDYNLHFVDERWAAHAPSPERLRAAALAAAAVAFRARRGPRPAEYEPRGMDAWRAAARDLRG
jgi:acetyl-CoA carboxylase biotin carboxylase subunit